jgi:hypothetical protein
VLVEMRFYALLQIYAEMAGAMVRINKSTEFWERSDCGADYICCNRVNSDGSMRMYWVRFFFQKIAGCCFTVLPAEKRQ